MESLLLLLSFLPLQDAPAPSLEDRLATMAGELDRRREELHVPGCSLAVVKDDRVVLARGFGLADVEQKTPVTPESLFAIGSSSKAFTATLVGMLADEGKLSWDDPIAEHLPYFALGIRDAPEGESATLRDLMCHRTGFIRGDILWASGRASREEILRTFARAEARAAFRKEWHYNNIMFLAAGEAAGVAAGKSWDELVRERLLEPLGMRDSNTSVLVAQKDPRLALGYRWDEEESRYVHLPMRVIDNCAPAGAINSNALDMARWLRFQLAGGEIEGRRLISAANLNETRTPQMVMSASAGYGLGWMLTDSKGRREVAHGGNIDGFTAEVAFLPDQGVGLVLLANVSASSLMGEVHALVWDALLEASAPPPAAASGVDGIARYLGNYVANFAQFRDATFQVVEKNGHLAIDVPGQMVFELQDPDGEGKWAFRITDQIAVSFDSDESGQVVGLRMYQAGMVFEVPRSGVAIPPEVAEADVTRFLGAYTHPVLKADFVVLIDHGRLAVDIPGQGLFHLHAPDANGVWLFRATTELGLRFDAEPDGRVPSLTFHERGTLTECPKLGADQQVPLPTAEALLALRRGAERGAALAALKGVRAEGVVRLPECGIEGKYALAMSGADRLRQEVDLAPFVRMVDVQRGSEYLSDTDITPFEAASPEEADHSRRTSLCAMLGDWTGLWTDVKPLRVAELEGRSCVVAELVAPDVAATSAWLDLETGDVLRLETSVPLRGMGRLPQIYDFGDWREVGGLRFPFRQSATNESTGVVIAELCTVRSGLELGDADFAFAPLGE
jgi:CubicO group peptidase (beta-lactamase class C family)